MDPAKTAQALASGGAYTAWFVTVVLAGVVVYLFKEVKKLNKDLVDAYKENDDEVLNNLEHVSQILNEHTTILSTVLGILRGRG